MFYNALTKLNANRHSEVEAIAKVRIEEQNLDYIQKLYIQVVEKIYLIVCVLSGL